MERTVLLLSAEEEVVECNHALKLNAKAVYPSNRVYSCRLLVDVQANKDVPQQALMLCIRCMLSRFVS